MTPADHKPLVAAAPPRPGAADDLERLPSTGFEAMKQLSRHGYAPDPQGVADSGGVLMRHRSAPDLIVYPDGTVRLAPTQSLNSSDAPASRRMPRVSWGRGLLFLFVLVVYTAISAIIAINLIAD